MRVKIIVKRSLPEKKLDNKKPIILFLGVDAGLRPHFMAHCILARTLRLMGHNAVLLRCYKKFDRCTVIESIPLKQRIDSKSMHCIDCVNNSYQWADEYEIPCLDIDKVMALNHFPSDKEIEENGIHFSYHDIPFGRICLTDILRNYKISSPKKVEQEMFPILIQYIKDSVRFYLIIQNIKKQYNISNIVYFGDYSFLFGAVIQCMRDGTKISTLHQPAIFFISRDQIIIENNIWGNEIKKLPQHFKKWTSVCLSEKEIDVIANDVIFKLENREQKIYSPPKSFSVGLHSQLGIGISKKILVAYTSSSDEMDALQNNYDALNIELVTREQPFEDQIDWIRSLIDFVKNHEDFFLIIRIHPREGGGKDGIPSEHFQKLKVEFKEVYANTKIIWPNDAISSYDLAELADLVLISWSNIGNDLMRLAVPVLPAFNIDWVYSDCVLKDKKQYFEMIINKLESNTTINEIRNAFHWFHIRILGSAVDLSDIVPDKHFWSLPKKFSDLPQQSLWIERALCHNEKIIDMKFEERQKKLDSKCFELEKEYFLKNIKRMIFFLLNGEVKYDVVNIRTFNYQHENEIDISLKENELLLSVHYPNIVYSLNGRDVLKKYSPMVARLAKLLA